MYSKLRTQQLIAKKVPGLIKLFHLDDWVINFQVYKEGDKGLKKTAPLYYKGYHGVSFLGDDKTADIIIFVGKTEKETYSTIIHELLHCVVSPLSSHVTLLQHKASIVEEDLVRLLEQILIERL